MSMRNKLGFCVALVGVMSIAATADEKDGAQKADKAAASRLQAVRLYMKRIEIGWKADNDRQPLKFNLKPLLRYDHPQRGILDSCVFRMGEEGRPTVLVTAELYGREGQRRVLLNHEFIAVHEPGLRLRRGAFEWEPPDDAVTFHQFDATMAPVKVKQVRLTQMQRLADRFKISETWRGKRSDLERFGAPIHRYKPSDNANSDGALFIFALGDNPEAILFIESDGQNWSWGLAPLGAAKMEAKIGDEVVWEFGGGESQQPLRTAAYAWLHLNETLPDDLNDKDADKENGKDAGDED